MGRTGRLGWMSGNLIDERAESRTDGSRGELTAHCDGGSRGNPGPAGYGAVLENGQGRVMARLSEFLGVQTNNYAEYAGLLASLKWALEHGYKRLRVVSDSELMVKQMKGQYKVASPGLKPLWEEAKRLSRQLEKFEMGHTLRGGNKEADRLANEAMDRGVGKRAGGGTPGPVSANAYAKPGEGQKATQPSGGGPKQPRQILEGYVKDGVVHVLEGELPDGIFVKVIRE